MERVLALAASCLFAACSGSTRSDFLPNPGEPNDSIATATPFTFGAPVVATISSDTDYDYYRITVPAGGATVNVRTFDSGGVECDPITSTVDTYVEVFDGAGNSVAFSDDSGLDHCEDIAVALPEGANFVAVGGYPPYPFVYTLAIDLL